MALFPSNRPVETNRPAVWRLSTINKSSDSIPTPTSVAVVVVHSHTVISTDQSIKCCPTESVCRAMITSQLPTDHRIYRTIHHRPRRPVSSTGRRRARQRRTRPSSSMHFIGSRLIHRSFVPFGMSISSQSTRGKRYRKRRWVFSECQQHVLRLERNEGTPTVS